MGFLILPVWEEKLVPLQEIIEQKVTRCRTLGQLSPLSAQHISIARSTAPSHSFPEAGMLELIRTQQEHFEGTMSTLMVAPEGQCEPGG